MDSPPKLGNVAGHMDVATDTMRELGRTVMSAEGIGSITDLQQRRLRRLHHHLFCRILFTNLVVGHGSVSSPFASTSHAQHVQPIVLTQPPPPPPPLFNNNAWPKVGWKSQPLVKGKGKGGAVGKGEGNNNLGNRSPPNQGKAAAPSAAILQIQFMVDDGAHPSPFDGAELKASDDVDMVAATDQNNVGIPTGEIPSADAVAALYRRWQHVANELGEQHPLAISAHSHF